MNADLEKLCINTIRCLSADTVQKANSGHPGAPMGCAPMAHVLMTRMMRMNPANSHWASSKLIILINNNTPGS
jgi:transketolase